jgi:hypothetical protein
MPARINNTAKEKEAPQIKAKSFQAVTFFDDLQKRQVIVLYSLGEDGLVREYTNGKWTPFPIQE